MPGDELVCLAAADPANLLGTVLAGPKVARVAGARVVYRGGVPLAASVAGEIEFLAPLDAGEKAAVARALAQGPAPLGGARLAAATAHRTAA